MKPSVETMLAIWGCAPGETVKVKIGDAIICGVIALNAIDSDSAIVKVQWLDSGHHISEQWFSTQQIERMP